MTWYVLKTGEVHCRCAMNEEFCMTATDKEIAEKILEYHRFNTALADLKSGRIDFKLTTEDYEIPTTEELWGN